MAGERFDELRALCTAAGDKASLAIGMAGLVIDLTYQGRMREASQLASEAMALIESLDDPTLMVGLFFAPVLPKLHSGGWCDLCDALRWSQTAIDVADGEPSRGNFIVGSPLAVAFTMRGMARCGPWVVRDGATTFGRAWRSRRADPVSYTLVVCWVYHVGILTGVLKPDDSAVNEIEDAVRIAERSSDDLALSNTRVTLGVALVYRQTAAERDRGHKLLAGVSEMFLFREYFVAELPVLDVYLARERARRGDRDAAIPLMRAAVDDLVRQGQLLGWGVPATGVLVETLLDRGTDGDVADAEAAIERLATAPTDDGLPVPDIWLMRLHALLARAHGDAAAYAHLRDRYRDMAKTLEFDGHIAWAEAVP